MAQETVQWKPFVTAVNFRFHERCGVQLAYL